MTKAEPDRKEALREIEEEREHYRIVLRARQAELRQGQL